MSDKKRAPKKVAIDYKNGKIYKLVNDVNDMIYIGSTTTTLSRRFSAHKTKASASSTANIHTAMREIGVDHFQIILIELCSCTCKAELEAREYAVMKEFSDENMYNSRREDKLDASARKKMSLAWTGKLGDKCNAFQRGCIAHSGNRFQFIWHDNGKRMTKSFGYRQEKTREMAYEEAVAYRDKIFPLTNEDQQQALPVADE